MQLHLKGLDVKTVMKAAAAADNYVLVHKDLGREKLSGQAKQTGEVEEHAAATNGGRCAPAPYRSEEMPERKSGGGRSPPRSSGGQSQGFSLTSSR